MKYEFAIKKDTLHSGKEIYTPVVRRKWGKISYGWQRIVCLYGKYTLLELDFEPELTYQQCEEHLKGYQSELLKKVEGTVREVEFHELETVLIPS